MAVSHSTYRSHGLRSGSSPLRRMELATCSGVGRGMRSCSSRAGFKELTARKYPAEVVRKIIKTYVMPRFARYLSMGLVLFRRRQPDVGAPGSWQGGQGIGQ